MLFPRWRDIFSNTSEPSAHLCDETGRVSLLLPRPRWSLAVSARAVACAGANVPFRPPFVVFEGTAVFFGASGHSDLGLLWLLFHFLLLSLLLVMPSHVCGCTAGPPIALQLCRSSFPPSVPHGGPLRRRLF